MAGIMSKSPGIFYRSPGRAHAVVNAQMASIGDATIQPLKLPRTRHRCRADLDFLRPLLARAWDFLFETFMPRSPSVPVRTCGSCLVPHASSTAFRCQSSDPDRQPHAVARPHALGFKKGVGGSANTVVLGHDAVVRPAALHRRVARRDTLDRVARVARFERSVHSV